MSLPARGSLGALLMTSAAIALAQNTVYTDQFMQGTEPGSLAIVADRVSSVANATRVTTLSGDQLVTVDHRPTCIIAINHHDPHQTGADTFAGVQIVKFYSDHDTGGVVQVGRNAGWFSVTGRRELPEIKKPTELIATTISDFASLHNLPPTETNAPFLLGVRHTFEWHGRASVNDADSYSAAEGNARFWSKNPMEFRELKSKHLEGGTETRVPRFDNRLLRFQLTDGVSVKHMPSAEFSCSDALLRSVAVRVYRPFSDGPDIWAHLKFR